MTEIGIISLALILANIAFSYKGFKDKLFFDAYKFEVDKILIFKEYKRLFSSGFLHVDWMHLIFNMVSLYAFSGPIENDFGGFIFLLLYFGSLLGGDLLALYIHKNHGDYSAVGASGAVCGIIFASIALFPGVGISLFGLSIGIPNWLYGILFVAYSIYGIKSKTDNIGHEAHLGGALFGMLIAIAIHPISIVENYLPIAIVLIPTIIFIYLIVTKPEILLIDNHFFKNYKKHYSIEHKYNEEKVNKQKEIDLLLDKISKKGIDSLSKKEKEKLEKFSK